MKICVQDWVCCAAPDQCGESAKECPKNLVAPKTQIQIDKEKRLAEKAKLDGGDADKKKDDDEKKKEDDEKKDEL